MKRFSLIINILGSIIGILSAVIALVRKHEVALNVLLYIVVFTAIVLVASLSICIPAYLADVLNKHYPGKKYGDKVFFVGAMLLPASILFYLLYHSDAIVDWLTYSIA